MILDGLNFVMEVRINDMESADVPNSRGSLTGNSPTSDRTQSFGQQGARPRTSSDQQNGRTRSFSGQQNGQQGFSSAQQYAGQRSSLQEQSTPFAASTNTHQPPPAPPAPKPKKQPEINLIDDFGPTVSVPAQSLIFDPLASVSAKISSAGDSTSISPPQQQQQPHQGQQQTAPVAAIPRPAAYVDPFAAVAAPVMAKPTGSINLDPFAAHNGAHQQHQYQQQHQQQHQQQQQQQHQQQQQLNRLMPMSVMNQNPMYQQPVGMAMGAPSGGMPIQQQQQQQQQGIRGSFTGHQPGAPGGMGNVNYNISQLMNPVSLQTGQQSQQGKSINIDAFASLSR
ncbi:unnamed protein product [Phytophthora fragariaefolia]|uniref:Unnamed protein product n=1 Tax=Phytophthora fragariaefolia TaxID=1490495 RepID=A0A9W6U7G9_9STRA|nr:unnamed protein product [Phytophthora fragariaefolia]